MSCWPIGWPWDRRSPAEEAVIELARRYLAAFGPAGPEDWAAWSGLLLTEGRAAWQALADELIAVEAAGRPAWLLTAQQMWLDAPPPAAPVVRLLGGYDTYLLGYRTRDLVLAPAYARRIHPGGGIIHPALLVDGAVVGTWRLTRHRAGVEITVTPFAPLAPAVLPLLDAEAADMARFLGQPGTLVVKREA